jgi:hypothetical protein
MELAAILSNGIGTTEPSGSITRQVVINVIEIMLHSETIPGTV